MRCFHVNMHCTSIMLIYYFQVHFDELKAVTAECLICDHNIINLNLCTWSILWQIEWKEWNHQKQNVCSPDYMKGRNIVSVALITNCAEAPRDKRNRARSGKTSQEVAKRQDRWKEMVEEAVGWHVGPLGNHCGKNRGCENDKGRKLRK